MRGKKKEQHQGTVLERDLKEISVVSVLQAVVNLFMSMCALIGVNSDGFGCLRFLIGKTEECYKFVKSAFSVFVASVSVNSSLWLQGNRMLEF